MTLQHRINLLVQLGQYMLNTNEDWVNAKLQASNKNPWFTQEFIHLSIQNIVQEFLQEEKLYNWANTYKITSNKPVNVGIVMAGNLPLVGFHDFLCVLIFGYKQTIKTSSKDEVLLKHIVNKLIQWDSDVANYIVFAENLKGCTAYIATGSNNSSKYFEYYFSKYPNIIRKNRTSVAILTGNETIDDLDFLASDIHLYFGLGCRNVTKLYVPNNYNFIPLLQALKKYDYFIDFHKYKHNYDYQLALLIMSNKLYMTNESILLSENENLFTAVSHLHYEYYLDFNTIATSLQSNNNVQCIVSNIHLPFGGTQQPSLYNYADGIDTMKFLELL